MCIRSLIAKSRNRPKSQLKVPGPRKLLKPELPSRLRQTASDPVLDGSYTSANPPTSYHMSGLPSFLGLPTISTIVGLFPGQPAPQSPQALNAGPLMPLITFVTCPPPTVAHSTPLPLS